jgi:hypothetical protein
MPVSQGVKARMSPVTIALNILRVLASVLGLMGLLLSISFAWFMPPAVLMVLYFGMSIYGTIALLPRLHCWLIAIAIQALPLYFVYLFRFQNPEVIHVIIAGLAVHALFWWASVGYASVSGKSYQSSEG